MEVDTFIYGVDWPGEVFLKYDLDVLISRNPDNFLLNTEILLPNIFLSSNFCSCSKTFIAAT